MLNAAHAYQRETDWHREFRLATHERDNLGNRHRA
jgi:hypothetical protein